MPVRPINSAARPGQPPQGVLRRVAVGIAADADDRQLRCQGTQQLCRGGILGAVVSRRQNLDVRQIITFNELFLRGPVHIAGDEEIPLPG